MLINFIWIIPDNCTRILLVADPQILGETFDTNAYSNLAIYDSDRYLASSYRQALGHARPHVVCFLGDLFDEGSVASAEEFVRYSKRFDRIFETLDKRIQVCWEKIKQTTHS